jgi:hypothetical protein
MSDMGDRLRRNSNGSTRRKIFSIVAHPAPSDSGRNPVRSILIFDNHPDSLRLLFQHGANPDVDLPTARHYRPLHLLLGLVLILVLILGMFWPEIVG